MGPYSRLASVLLFCSCGVVGCHRQGGATSCAMSRHSIGKCACPTTATHAVHSAAAQQSRRVPVASVYVLRGCVGQAAHPEGKRDSMLAAHWSGISCSR